jgi:isochorismate pyruvate lyase
MKVACRSLDEVRAHIDRLDREIVQLLSARGYYVSEAARFKTSSADVAAPGWAARF